MSKKDMIEKITTEANKHLANYKKNIIDARKEGIDDLEKLKVIVTQEIFKSSKDNFEKSVENFKKLGEEEVTKKI